jgi:hypothetical protein
MPNWSNTEIKLRGRKKIIEKIAKNVKEKGLDWGPFKMPKILSVYSAPAEIVDRDEWLEYAKECRKDPPLFGLTKMKESVAERLLDKYKFWSPSFWIKNPDWYGWAIANWGTKWNIDINEKSISLIENFDGEVMFYMKFSSAWSGPDVWFKRLCKLYKLSGEYVDSDEGSDFFHKIIYKNGKLIKEIETSYYSKEAAEYYKKG